MTYARPPAAMVGVGPPHLPRLVEKVLGARPLPMELISVLLDRFCVSGEDEGALSTEKCSCRPLHAFQGHLTSRPDPVPGFGRLALLRVDQDGMVHFLHSFFSVPVGLYSSTQQLFACQEKLSGKGLPLVVELEIDAFGLRCAMRAVPKVDHASHLEGAPPPE